MFLEKKEFARLVKEFKFKKLFNELGWDHVVKKEVIAVGNKTYVLEAVAEKRDFVIFACKADKGFPDKNTRKTIDRKISAHFHEHLIIFTDNQKQVWQLAVKEPNKPVQYKQTEYYLHQEPELLFQKLKGLFFTLVEEDKIGIVDVTARVDKHFNVNTEKTTKKFYDGFKKQHKSFMGFIIGLENQLDIDWYTSLMLNRLMFIYFIQKKGFLNNDVHYLRNKLKQTREQFGNNKFYSFYKTFLLVLFHKGLGEKSREDKQLTELIGQVPFLDGGLFDVHELEKGNKNINIDDAAFEKLFDFFDDYQWHLDTRIQASGNEINPDVIGYIFEKYINDRAAMGAYYTKEDITEYISKNTIIPFLFDQAKKGCANAFKKESGLWRLLKENPDQYIYDAVKKGCEYDDIPKNIACGINADKPDLLERRKDWNIPAPEKFGLPTEIWRETMARRQRYFEIKAKLSAGEIIAINDFITYNLNIRQFAQDTIEYYEGSDFINSFFNAITKIKILDPTCGSGAFLFAALNIMEPLYEGCIARMREFVEQDDTPSGKGKKFGLFREVMLDIDRHPNQKYWILKTIILNNLYGVDIMHEAVEIAKLRLFLKLAATAEVDYGKENLGLEPLPDIDFNIRAGNTLVGFASEKHLLEAVKYDKDGQYRIGYEAILEKFKEECEVVGMVFKGFKEAQLVEDPGSENFKQAKDVLGKRLSELNDKLNEYLAGTYDVVTTDVKKYQEWLNSHKPFHWFAEFYEIVQGDGGFDVIIGNPPYVEYSKVKKVYTIKGYDTEKCGNLYAFVIDRNSLILSNCGRTGMIVPHSAICTDRMQSLQSVLSTSNSNSWFATYCIRPAKLFTGVDQRLVIYLNKNNNNTFHRCSSKYHHWQDQFRPYLFDCLQYTFSSDLHFSNSFPKVYQNKELILWDKISTFQPFLNNFELRRQKAVIYFHNAPRYWIRAMDFAPYFWNERDGEQLSTQVKQINIASENDAVVAVSCLNSTLFYWWFIILSDCRHLNMREIENFPIGFDKMSAVIKNELIDLSKTLMKELKNCAKRKVCFYETTGKVVYDEYYPKRTKPVIDKIDKVLAKHYGFTDEELDFIINYDIKYRMGKELNP